MQLIVTTSASTSANRLLVAVFYIFAIAKSYRFLNELHLQGSSAGNIGREALWKMARDLGKQYNVSEVIIQGGRRTTGKYKGQVPSPISIKVN